MHPNKAILLFKIRQYHGFKKGNLRGGTRKVGKQERNRRKNEGERAGKKT